MKKISTYLRKLLRIHISVKITLNLTRNRRLSDKNNTDVVRKVTRHGMTFLDKYKHISIKITRMHMASRDLNNRMKRVRVNRNTVLVLNFNA